MMILINKYLYGKLIWTALWGILTIIILHYKGIFPFQINCKNLDPSNPNRPKKSRSLLSESTPEIRIHLILINPKNPDPSYPNQPQKSRSILSKSIPKLQIHEKQNQASQIHTLSDGSICWYFQNKFSILSHISWCQTM